MFDTLHIHQSIHPCIHGDIEQLSQYVHFQMTELMNWRAGCSDGTEVKGSQCYSALAAKTFTSPSSLLASILPLFLFSQTFQVTSLNFSLRSSPFHHFPSRVILILPPHPPDTHFPSYTIPCSRPLLFLFLLDLILPFFLFHPCFITSLPCFFRCFIRDIWMNRYIHTYILGMLMIND